MKNNEDFCKILPLCAIGNLFSLKNKIEEKNLHLLINPIKGMSNYLSILRKNPNNCVSVVKDFEEIAKSIEIVYDEYQQRKKVFQQSKTFSLKEYETKTAVKMVRIFLWIEDLNILIQSKEFNYFLMNDQPDHVAFKLKELFRYGRAYGIVFIRLNRLPQLLINN